MPPRTIDNLGVEVSTRYAEDRQILDETLVKESYKIPSQTRIEVTTPFVPQELEAILQAQPTSVTWASFIPPSKYFEQRNLLFTFQLIPSMGSEDKKESQALKILAKLKALTEQRVSRDKEHQNKKQQPDTEHAEEKNKKEQKNRQQQYAAERAEEEEKKEQKILTSLLSTIGLFDKLIIEINSRRSQYQKG